jgi:hypothetical protein
MQGAAAAVRRKLRIHRHDGGAVSDNKRRNNTFPGEHLRRLCNCVTYNTNSRNQCSKLRVVFTIMLCTRSVGGAPLGSPVLCLNNNLPRLLVYCTFFTDSGRNQRAAATRGTHAPRRMHVAGIKAHTVPSSAIIIIIAVIVIFVIVTASAIITISIGFMVRSGTLCIVLLIFFLFFVVKQVVKRHQVR